MEIDGETWVWALGASQWHIVKVDEILLSAGWTVNERGSAGDRLRLETSALCGVWKFSDREWSEVGWPTENACKTCAVLANNRGIVVERGDWL